MYRQGGAVASIYKEDAHRGIGPETSENGKKCSHCSSTFDSLLSTEDRSINGSSELTRRNERSCPFTMGVPPVVAYRWVLPPSIAINRVYRLYDSRLLRLGSPHPFKSSSFSSSRARGGSAPTNLTNEERAASGEGGLGVVPSRSSFFFF